MSVYGLVYGSTADEDNALLKDLLEADRVIDKSTNPWALVLLKRGSGPLGEGQELLRQSLYDTNGNPLNEETQTVGRVVSE